MKNIVYFTDASFKSSNEKSAYGYFRFVFHDDTKEEKIKKLKLKKKVFNNNNSAELQALKLAVKSIKKYNKKHFLDYFFKHRFKFIIVTDSDWVMNVLTHKKPPKDFTNKNANQLKYINRIINQLDKKIDIHCVKSHTEFTEQFKKAYSLKLNINDFQKYLKDNSEYTYLLSKGNQLIDSAVNKYRVIGEQSLWLEK